MKIRPSRARCSGLSFRLTASASRCASCNSAPASNPSAVFAGRSSASAISPRAGQGRLRSPSHLPRPSPRAACISMCFRAATAGVPRFQFWLTPMAQQKTSATSRSSSRANHRFPSTSRPNATKPDCLRNGPGCSRNRLPKRRKIPLEASGSKLISSTTAFSIASLPATSTFCSSASRDLNDHLLPAGNLREPLHAAERAHVIAIPADEPEVEATIKALRLDGSCLAHQPPHGYPQPRRSRRRLLRHRASRSVFSRPRISRRQARQPGPPSLTTTSTPLLISPASHPRPARPEPQPYSPRKKIASA